MKILVSGMLLASLMAVGGYSQSALEAPEIVDIQFEGNNNLTSKQLLDQIRLKEKRWVSKGSYYNRHHLAREIERLEDYYKLHGFLDANITDSLAISENNVISIFLQVDEGKQYYLRDVNLSGNTVFSEEQYLEIIEFQAGSIFNTFKIRENLMEMILLYQNNGYPLINIQDSEIIDDSVSLYIRVEEGPKLNIGSINISEMEQVSTNTIEREIIVKPGDLYKLTNIEESKRRLYETSLFNSVNIRLGKVDTISAIIDLDVELIPAKFRGFDMNMGVKQGFIEEAIHADPVLSIGVSGSWYNNNLFDQSRRISVKTKLSSIYPAIFIPQQFKLDFFYVEPWLSKYRIPLTINPFYWYIDNSRTGFENVAYGLRGIMTYRWFRKIKIQSLAEWSQSNTNRKPIGSDEAYSEARKVGLKFTWDERDNFFYPHHGFKWVIEPGIVGYFLGGENNYMQFQTQFSSYWNLFADLVFAHNINFGIAVQRDADIPIPYEKRFFLGGNSSIRGYEQQMVGPMRLEDGEWFPTGGNFRLYMNMEFRFPLYGILGGEVFMDVGNLWAEIQDARISDIKTAIGLGITIETPIGPARIDHGFVVEPGAIIKAGQTHIAIAYVF
ncbi:MAG: BamA/TamA family outer membrane protein [Candidatus Marinimicrobia bacterium]|nr:BamA/TamA family outer membrane protein [Candidatus Neomarinimicrobiota bacterium]